MSEPPTDEPLGYEGRDVPADARATAAKALVLAIPSPVVTAPRPDLLVIRPSLWDGYLGFGWAAMAGVCSGLAWLAVFYGGLPGGAPNGLMLALTGSGFLFWLIFLLPVQLFNRRLQYVQARFDRTRGELTVGGLHSQAAPRRLESVKVVEVVDGRENRLNLLLDDVNWPRLTLIKSADAALVRRVAERVASFLGVPLQQAN